MRSASKILLVLLILFLASCKKSAEPSIADSIDSQIEAVREKASEVVEGINKTIQPEPETQTVYVQVPQQEASSEVISMTYESPCVLKKYRVLNSYCGAKTFWHNQSTLLSWYVPYAVVLLALAAAVFVIWLIRRNK